MVLLGPVVDGVEFFELSLVVNTVPHMVLEVSVTNSKIPCAGLGLVNILVTAVVVVLEPPRRRKVSPCPGMREPVEVVDNNCVQETWIEAGVPMGS